MKDSRSGFTIVELLVVIVIIAILAAITIVAFSGFTMRAHNTARIQSAQNMMKAAKAYIAANGPEDYIAKVNTNTNYCLGKGFEDLNISGTSKACWVMKGPELYILSNSALDTAIDTISSPSVAGFPKISVSDLTPGTTYEMTAPYMITLTGSPDYSVDGVIGKYGQIVLYLDGVNQDCGFGKQLVYLGKTGSVSRYSTTTGAKNSAYTATKTLCNYHFYPE